VERNTEGTGLRETEDRNRAERETLRRQGGEKHRGDMAERVRGKEQG
jgi:hypothetical protein